MKIDYKTRDTHAGARIASALAAAAVVLAGHLCPGQETPLSEMEPNDTLATAMGKGLIGEGTVTILGQVGDGAWGDLDVDLYFLVIDTNTSLPVRFTATVSETSPGFDAYLRLFDGAGTELSNNDDGSMGGQDAGVQTILLKRGVYFVGVSSAANPRYNNAVGGSGRTGSGGAYALSMTTEAAPPPPSFSEPNDTFETATHVGSESFIIEGKFIGNGQFDRRDVDVYRLGLTGPARLDIEVRAEGIGSTLDPTLQVERMYENGLRVLMGVNDDAPDGSVDSRLSVGVPETSFVYVIVYGAGNPKYRSPTHDQGEPGSVGYYDLEATVSYFDASGANESNDSILQATPTPWSFPRLRGAPNFHRFSGAIGDGPYSLTRGDRDFYELTVTETGVITAEVAASSIGSDLEPVLVLYDASGYRVALDDGRGAVRDVQLIAPVSCLDPDAYDPVPLHLMVMGTRQRFPNDPFVPYAADQTGHTPRSEEFAAGDGPGSTGTYELSLSWSASDETCGAEPDDTLATATDTGIVDEGMYVCTNAWIGNGSCENPDLDVDMWSVRVLRAPASLRVVAAACRSDEDPLEYGMIRLFDASGNELARTLESWEYDDGPIVLETLLSEPETYYIGLTDEYNNQYDPTEPCSGVDGYFGEYDIILTLTQGVHRSNLSGGAAASTQSPVEEDVPWLFATRLDDAGDRIQVFNAVTGFVAHSFPAPEPLLGGSEGLASDGSRLYFVGAGRQPRIYRLDPSSGDVLDEYILWMGSGYYSDAVMLGGELYLLDYYDRSIHVVDPIGRRFLRSLAIGSTHGIAIGGGLGALAGPNRLYVADAFHPPSAASIYEIDPLLGTLTDTLAVQGNRPTALAGIGTSTLFVADWDSDVVEVTDRTGTPVDQWSLTNPVGSLAGRAWDVHCIDSDGDSICDLDDNCPNDANPDQTDGDGDGHGDACDLCPRFDDGQDADGDGEPDGCDSCTDTDGDGFGEPEFDPSACAVDICPGFDDNDDLDEDGVPDDCDNCPSHGNFDQADCDDDGRGDVCVLADCPPDDNACRDCNDNGVPDACDVITREVGELTAPDASPYIHFGYSVAISGWTLIVGAPYDTENGSSSGSAHAFGYDPGGLGHGPRWGHDAKLTPADGGEGQRFGVSVSLCGSLALVGAPQAGVNGSAAGAAYVFREVPAGPQWQEEAKLTASDASESASFGASVSVRGEAAVVGAPDGAVGSGAAYVYRSDARTSTWHEEAKLTASDGATGEYFGRSVSISDNRVVVGASWAHTPGQSSGAAYVFRLDGALWQEEAKLVASDGDTYARFGHSVAIDGETIVVGATGQRSAYVFRYDRNAFEWVEEAKLTVGDSAADDWFGNSVSISGHTIVVGAQAADEAGTDSGAAYVFRYDPSLSTWVLNAKLTPSELSGYGRYGESVSISGNTVAAGAPWNISPCPTPDPFCRPGSAFAFSLPSDCNGSGVPDECETGDTNGDGAVDLYDHAMLSRCLDGPRAAPVCGAPGVLPGCCSVVDFDADGDIDLSDAASFQRAFTGP